MFDLSAASLEAILPFIAIGFAAQLVDGALGMAFGLINSTLLVSVMGMPPALASASVHAVETFTTAASGTSHVLHRNVNWRLFARLVIPGHDRRRDRRVCVVEYRRAVAKPFVMAYLAAIGLYLLYRGVCAADASPRRPRSSSRSGWSAASSTRRAAAAGVRW